MNNLLKHIAIALSIVTPVMFCSCKSPTTENKLKPGPVDAPVPPEFQTTESGLKYRILRASDGAKPKVTNRVKVHYVGTLDDGTEFDSSYRLGKPATFGLGQVVAGWTEGLQLVGKGGMIELEIPPNLGYGLRGSPGSIPPNSTLHFTVELLDIR